MKRFALRHWYLLLLCCWGCADDTAGLNGVWVPDVMSTFGTYETESPILKEALRNRLSDLEIQFDDDGTFYWKRAGAQRIGTFEVIEQKDDQSILLIRGFGHTQRFVTIKDTETLTLIQGTDSVVMRRP